MKTSKIYNLPKIDLKYVELRGNSYRISIPNGYNADGTQNIVRETWTPPMCMTKKQIEDELFSIIVSMKNDISNGHYVINKTIKFSEVCDEWFRQKEISGVWAHGTLKRYQNCRDLLVAELGNKPISQIRLKDVQECINKIGAEKGLSEKTQKNCITVLNGVFKFAKKYQYVKENPCADGIEIVHKESKERETYTIEEVQNIFNLMVKEPLRYLVFHILAFFCGFRRGELLGLEWKDINFEENTIKVTRASLYSNEKGIYESNPKTVKSRRTVRVDDNIMGILKMYKEEQDEYKASLGDLWNETDRLFTQWNGLPMGTSTQRNWFEKFCKKNNIRFLTTHCCRHFAASVLIKSGCDVASVSAALGHSKITTTLNVYSHEFEDSQSACVDAVSNFITIPGFGDKE